MVDGGCWCWSSAAHSCGRNDSRRAQVSWVRQVSTSSRESIVCGTYVWQQPGRWPTTACDAIYGALLQEESSTGWQWASCVTLCGLCVDCAVLVFGVALLPLRWCSRYDAKLTVDNALKGVGYLPTGCFATEMIDYMKHFFSIFLTTRLHHANV